MGALEQVSHDTAREPQSVLVNGGVVLTPKGLRAARLYLEQLYRREGYVYIKVEKPDVSPLVGENRVRVVFHVKEGPQMRVGSISVRPSPPFSLGAFLQETSLVPGQPLDGFAVEDSRLRLLRLYEQNGYPWVKVAERLEPVAREKMMDVSFDVSSGPLVRVGDIQVEGNQVTRKEVILEQIVLRPGEPFGGWRWKHRE